MKISLKLLTFCKCFLYCWGIGFTLGIFKYIIIILLYGFISKIDQSDNPTKITFGKISILIVILFLYYYYYYKYDYHVRNGISEFVNYVYLNHNIINYLNYKKKKENKSKL